jgi:hypothetical protein
MCQSKLATYIQKCNVVQPELVLLWIARNPAKELILVKKQVTVDERKWNCISQDRSHTYMALSPTVPQPSQGCWLVCLDCMLILL